MDPDVHLIQTLLHPPQPIAAVGDERGFVANQRPEETHLFGWTERAPRSHLMKHNPIHAGAFQRDGADAARRHPRHQRFDARGRRAKHRDFSAVAVEGRRTDPMLRAADINPRRVGPQNRNPSSAVAIVTTSPRA